MADRQFRVKRRLFFAKLPPILLETPARFFAVLLNTLKHKRLRQFQLLGEEFCDIGHGALKVKKIIPRDRFRAIEKGPVQPAREPR